MKYILFLIILFTIPCKAFAEKRDSVSFTINSKQYLFKVGDTLTLGLGSNPDGSFMYILNGKKEGMSKLYSGKKVVIKKIDYNKAMQWYTFEIVGKGILRTAYVPQVFDKKEIVALNGVLF
jgi:hypothetical protein